MFLALRFAKKKYREIRDRKQETYRLQSEAEPPERRSGDGWLDPQTSSLEGPVRAPNRHSNIGLVASDTTSPPAPHLTEIENGAKNTQEKKPETPEQIAAKKRRRKYRLKIILAMFLPFTLQALDTTVIASALPLIAREFSALICSLVSTVEMVKRKD